jgi:hypothetical protein
MSDDVDMVGHDRKAADLDGEHVGQQGDAIFNPLLAMLVLVAAEEQPACAAAEAVIPAGLSGIDNT